MNPTTDQKRDEYALHAEIFEEAKKDAAECGLGDHFLLSQMRWEEIVRSRELKRLAQNPRTRTRYRVIQ